MSTDVPPPIPPQAPPIIGPRPPIVSAQSLGCISGAEGLTAAGLREAVAQGGRFVLFQYCFSVLVLSFKRSSPIFFIKPGESALAKGAPYSLISLFAGWWGIPWGPIWTLTTLANNISGGKDVTNAVVSSLGGAITATAAAPPLVSPTVAAERESRKSFILRLAWGIVALLFLGMGWVGYKVYEAGSKAPATPGEAEFRAANNRIGGMGEGDSGNTPQAAELASQMSQAMQAIRATRFEEAKEKSFMDEHDQFKTYCDLRTDQCVVLIHVPELRKFGEKAQKSLGDLAWLAAQRLIEKRGQGKTGMRLAVGLRGIAAYSRVLTGEYVPGASEAKTGILDVHEGIGCEREFYAWFAEQPQPSGTADSEGAPAGGAPAAKRE